VWNTWYTGYGNTAEGFAELNARISDAAARAGRDPAEVERSACVLVELEPGPRRPSDGDVRPVGPSTDAVAAHLRGLAEAGADEAILVVEPITVGSIRALAEALAAL
jgi:alkanesulfonate monooxygenase SsuD/methylene tetrahydromethanopterin reductase-like flavin-dependent oxidoreductase (luciferase family)